MFACHSNFAAKSKDLDKGTKKKTKKEKKNNWKIVFLKIA